MNAPIAMPDNVTYRMSPVQGTERGLAALARRVGAAAQYVIDLPRRRAVIDELSRLTDRELADIGLSRSELKQVFAKARA